MSSSSDGAHRGGAGGSSFNAYAKFGQPCANASLHLLGLRCAPPQGARRDLRARCDAPGGPCSVGCVWSSARPEGADLTQ